MVQAMINISEEVNQILNIAKAKHNLKDKSSAIEYIVTSYGTELLEPKLRPEFIERMRARSKEPTVRIKNFRKHFGLE